MRKGHWYSINKGSLQLLWFVDPNTDKSYPITMEWISQNYNPHFTWDNVQT